MSKYTVTQARSIAISCASHYEKNLKNKQFIIIYRDYDTKSLMYIEPVFLSRNFQHLTGINLLNEDGTILNGCSEYFYEKCINKKLGNTEIGFKKDGTSQLKLEALPAITKFTSITKIIGDSNGKQPYLYIDKIVGGVNFCLGLRVDTQIHEYVPASALQRDIKELTDTPSQVLAIMERRYGDRSPYKIIRHVAKGVNLLNINFPDAISTKIDLTDYIPKNK